jgi:hypothetical protein
MDNSKAEEYARLAFFCQWICANKRRLNNNALLRSDGARFYQLVAGEYSLSTIKIDGPGEIFPQSRAE